VSHGTFPVRSGAVLLAVAGLLLALSPLTRPWTDESTLEGATGAMGSGAWVASHVFAMLGLILVVPGVVAVWVAMRRTRAEVPAAAAMVAMWFGVALTLPYYGAETFGLHAVAKVRADVLPEVVDAFRFDAVAITTFGFGLVALAVGGVLTAVALRRSGSLARHAGVPLAIGYLLFLPQFLMPAPVRIGHGVLMGIGCGWIAQALWHAPRVDRSEQT